MYRHLSVQLTAGQKRLDPLVAFLPDVDPMAALSARMQLSPSPRAKEYIYILHAHIPGTSTGEGDIKKLEVYLSFESLPCSISHSFNQ
jgi:hypothetical protein